MAYTCTRRPPPVPVLTVPQAARLLGVTPAFMRAFIRLGAWPPPLKKGA